MIHKIIKVKVDKSKRQTVEQRTTVLAHYGAGKSKFDTEQDHRADYIAGTNKGHDDEDALSEKTEFLVARNITSPLPTLTTPFIKVHEMDWSQIGEEIGEVKSQRGVHKPAQHRMISLKEGEHLDRKQWLKLVRDYMKGMGMQNTKYLAFIHNDTDKQHVHIVNSHVDIRTKKIINQWQNYKKATELMRGFEKEYNLGEVANPGQMMRQTATTSFRETPAPKGKRTKNYSGGDKAQIKRKIDFVLLQNSELDVKPTLLEFIDQLNAVGVQVKLTYTRFDDTEPSGMSYRLNRYEKSSSIATHGNSRASNGKARAKPYFKSSKLGSSDVFALKNLKATEAFVWDESERAAIKKMNLREGAREFGVIQDEKPPIEPANILRADAQHINVVLKFKEKDLAKLKAVIGHSLLRTYLQLYNQSGSKSFDSKLHAYVFRVRINKRWHREQYSQEWLNQPKMTKDQYLAKVDRQTVEMLLEFIKMLLEFLGFGTYEIETSSHLGDYQKQPEFAHERKDGRNTVITIEDILNAIKDAGEGGHVNRYNALCKQYGLEPIKTM
ncbi:relaxase/mobilization nuclease domain-containing protein [Vibrio sp. F74]|uniref:relaxase/mobilization nuclease domain-containing protein n=1 Tax=Vibrio sp. F74 TaxID=700020 RepID=UPI0035F5C0FB